MGTYLEQSLAKLEEFEGSVPWMYVDTVGKVTVGVGLMLPNAAAAEIHPFTVGGRAATVAEIAAEFARVDALPMGRPAEFYRRAGGPELEKPAIDALLRSVLLGFEAKLRAGIAGYDTLPDGVKLALLDMAYNLGPAGLLDGYPKLLKAVAAGNWAHAAASCFRHGPGAARNQWTQAMFLSGVVRKMQAASEGAWKRLGYGLVGLAASLWERRKK
jgi:GH24 family phage-related lysozyme (muramidase)